MSDRSLQNPPTWCKHAIPTVKGWADPNTGEILKRKKGLLAGKIKVEEIEEIVIEAVADEQAIEVALEVEEPVVKQPVKPAKKRGRPRKNALKST